MERSTLVSLLQCSAHLGVEDRQLVRLLADVAGSMVDTMDA